VIFIYTYSTYFIIAYDLVKIDPTVSNDYFDRDDHNTLKFFTERKLEETVKRYFLYIREHFEDKIKDDPSNFK